MYKLRYSSKMKKDLKNCQKRNFDLSKLEAVINQLRIPQVLEIKNRDHALTGNYIGFRECHIMPDWLLIYRYKDEYLELVRTGTHADLFRM